MKLIIAGGRNLKVDIDLLKLKVNDLFPNQELEIVEGGATGIDTCAKEMALKYDMKHTQFPADWDKLKRAAGPIRNGQMAKYADVLFLVWDGKSRGSANMKMQMERLNKPVFELILDLP